MELKPGSRWKSSVCPAEVVVVKPPKTESSLECGGHPMVPIASEAPDGVSLVEVSGEIAQMGKRYFDEETGIELLCSKGGAGALTLNGRALRRKEPKALPSSD